MRKKAKQSGPVYEVWRKLKQNKFAVASMVIVIGLIILAIIAPWVAPYNYAEQNYDILFQPPSLQHFFGTDNFGRDVFSRIIYGSRYTVFIGFGCNIIAMVVGVSLGLAAAYFKKCDNIIMRVMDVIIGMPGMTLLICLIAVMGTSILNMVIALCITSIPEYARLARAQAMTLKNQEYIEAALSVGASDFRILFNHILPNSLAPIIVQFTLATGGIALMSASLSFIGMGVQAPLPEWGLMISEGRQYLREYWHLSIIPGIAIIILTFALNYLGDGLRDALDPRLNK